MSPAQMVAATALLLAVNALGVSLTLNSMRRRLNDARARITALENRERWRRETR